MKALVVAPQPFFSPRGTPLSVYYRTLITAEMGVKVDVLTYGQGQDVDIPGVRIIRIPHFFFLGKVRVGPSRLKLILDGFLALWTVVLLVRTRYDFVHAHEEAIFFCRALKPVFGYKLVYDMHSSLPQQLVNFRFTSSRFLIRLFEKLEKSGLTASDAVITICPGLAQYALGLLPDPARHLLIENSIFEPVRLASGPGEQQRSPVHLPESAEGRRLIMYAGTLEPYQGVDILIQSLATVLEAIPNAYLVVMGGTRQQVEEARSVARGLNLMDHCLFTGTLPQEQARNLLASACVQVSPRREGTNTPLKIYEQMASGIPLVATNIYSHTQVLSEEVAFLVDPEPKAMARGIITALADGDLAGGRVTRAKELYARKYSRQVYESKMRTLLGLVS